MKNIMKIGNAIEKKWSNEITSSEKKVSDSTQNTASNTPVAPSSVEVTKTSKKDLSYIFQLNVTKKKLQQIENKIEKLQNQSLVQENIIQEKYLEYQTLLKQYQALSLKYTKNFTIFSHTLNFYGMTDDVILDAQKREEYIRYRIAEYIKWLVEDAIINNKESFYCEELERNYDEICNNGQKKSHTQQGKNKQDESEHIIGHKQIAQEIRTLIDQEDQSIRQYINTLYSSYFNLEIEADVLNQKQVEIDNALKEIDVLQKKISNIQTLINKSNDEYAETNELGVLKWYEYSWPKVSIDDFVANPTVENQMKKLIALYTHQNETKRFWLSLSKSIIFIGEPETGKTFAAKMFASEIDRKMYHIKAHDLFSENIGDPNQMLYAIFSLIIQHVQQTKESCVIFLDEIEKIIDSVWEYNPAEQKIISNTIIKNITNIQKSNLDIVVLAALGYKNKINPDFMKYSLFDNQFFFELPKEAERKKYFELFIAKAEKRAKLKLFNPDVIDDLVKATDWFSAEYIKQLINSCVKEYAYSYIQNKPSLAIDQDYIWITIEQINRQNMDKPSNKNPLNDHDKKKLINSLITQSTMKNLIFGELDTKKKDALLSYIIEHSDGYSEDDFRQIFKLCAEEYQRRNISYHRQFLIQKDFILDKIQALREEDRRKGRGSYFNRS